jgi:peptidyl-dipeptidase Dcp
MKKLLVSLFLIFSFIVMTNADNVLLSPFRTTHGAIPFDRISNADFEPAIDYAINKHNREIDSITSQAAEPTFQNTIVALERSGSDLDRIINVYSALLSANADDSLMNISFRVSPKLSHHSTSITLNQSLWERVKFVHDHVDMASLSEADKMLLKNTYDDFFHSGANLQGADRDKYRKLTAELSELSLKYGQNVLKELNTYELWLTRNDLDGLPESAVEAAQSAAKAKGKDGYLITLDAPSYSSFMKYSSRRDLREKLYKMNSSRNTKGEFSNIEIMCRIANDRLAFANLLGYPTYADYNLENTMAEKPANVYKLLNQLKDAYLPVQKRDMLEVTQYASSIENKPMKINGWDYAYYSNKLKDFKYKVNDEVLRPYFRLENVIKGVFGFATRLYGLKFTENYDAQVFNPEVRAFNVTDGATGKYVGLLYTDFFPRSTKRDGAWMTDFTGQQIDDKGNDIRPVVSLTMNFTRPTETKPSLLTLYEVDTFIHEFGHALHSLLSDVKYESLAGTNVYHDFVEMPSQFNENYVHQKEFLDSFACNYKTGQKIPQELIDKIVASSQFGAAYSCIRQLDFGFIDMAWHTITSPVSPADAEKIEQQAIKGIEIFPHIPGCILSPQFNHIFSGGYAAGYYGYKWAEVLDADAFSKFQEDGLFNKATAKSFRDNILSRGGTEPPMVLYKRFRGHEPTIDALLRRDGIKK